MSQAAIVAAFPRLRRAQFFITSPASNAYNCIAWAAGDTKRVWWPHHPPTFAYWPPGVERKEELPAFTAVFATLGYAPCADGNLEPGFEKLALFADAQGKPKHAAKQLPSGKWTSKLGLNEDISHTIYGLGGAEYGDVVQYLKRKIPPRPNTEKS